MLCSNSISDADLVLLSHINNIIVLYTAKILIVKKLSFCGTKESVKGPLSSKFVYTKCVSIVYVCLFVSSVILPCIFYHIYHMVWRCGVWRLKWNHGIILIHFKIIIDSSILPILNKMCTLRYCTLIFKVVCQSKYIKGTFWP